MRFASLVGLVLIIAMLSACQPSPPTVVYIVISPTPDTSSASPEALSQPVTEEQVSSATPTSPPVTNTPAPTSTPDIFPTETIAQIQVAEQVYEGGRMFWLQPVGQIWVMVVDEEGRGRWLRYEDTWIEGEEPETDPSIVPPDGKFQPERGFGKLWRENPEVRESLGWAITPEFGYISQYEYHPGGTVENNRYVQGFGYHILYSLNSEAFRFIEENSTWRLN